MPIPSKKRDAEAAAAMPLAPSSVVPPPTANRSWLPAGINRPMVISEGEHIARIDNIYGFESKKFKSYKVVIMMVCQDGEEGNINLTFSNDDSKSWINARNSNLFGQFLTSAGLTVPSGEYPDWDDLTDRLQGIWFKIQIGIGKSGSPYLISLKALQDGQGPTSLCGSNGRSTTVERDMDSIDEPADADFDDVEGLE